MSMSYKDAGVDIDAGNEAVERIKKHVKTTFNSSVLTGLGAFGSLVDLKSLVNQYDHPVLVQSIDGVGTKTVVARMANYYEHLGEDLVSAACNDIVVMGAMPITFLDYIANDKLDPAVVETLVAGMSRACEAIDTPLVGGETAEMPDIYVDGEHDLVGVITGLVDKDKVIDGRNIKEGDVVLGLASSGLHTNGFSLARKCLFDKADYKIDEVLPELGEPLYKVLLQPHINYTNPVRSLINNNVTLNGLVHITGGGFFENIPRVLPEGLGVNLQKDSWPVLPIFDVMKKAAELDEFEMYRTFNMGIGLVMIVPSSEVEKIEGLLDDPVYRIGEVVSGEEVTLS